MSDGFPINPPEPPLPFTGATIDRATELRNDRAALSALLAESSPQVVCATNAGLVVEPDGSGLRRLELRGDAARLVADDSQTILLGIENGRPLLAVDLEGSADGLGDHARVITVREAGMLLAPAEAGLAAYISALLNWHRRHRFCSVCGAATGIAEAGLSRKCPECGSTHFPRTDPSVIMLVEDEGRILLGSRVGWPADRFSVLAGFVAPGETPEEAVTREVHEESGITAHSPRYVASQPWPFPSSLMLGYEATGVGGEPVAQESEMTAVRWFTLAEVAAAQRGGGAFELPGKVSIARFLIDAWVARGGRRL